MRKHIGIIGGGITGLVAGYELAKAGMQVAILERDQCMGGLASSFAISPGQEIERYYHFICRPDRPYLDMMSELDLIQRLRWVVTEMGLFYHHNTRGNSVHTIGDPLNLLLFPYLSISDKMRFFWATAATKFASSTSWKTLEHIGAQEWLIKRYGQRAYDVLYGPLLDLKFREYAPKISAAWMWARFYRLGNSRTVTQKEYVGYLEGGTKVYVDALVQALGRQGANLYTSIPVERVMIENGRAIGLQCREGLLQFDSILSTVPIPHLTNDLLASAIPYPDNLRQLEYIDVVVMVMRLRHKFSKYFWMNISDPEIDLAGIIEYTNLNPCPDLGGDVILYLPQYLPATHPFHDMTDEDLFDLYCSYLHRIKPSFEPDWVLDYWVHRHRFAQPICDLNFSERIPSIQTPVEGMYMTDSYQLHPDDRTVSGSTDLGRKAARLIIERIAST